MSTPEQGEIIEDELAATLMDPVVPTPKPTSLDIHDTSRDKIVIRPRCKEYAKKRRATLACFTAMSFDESPTKAGNIRITPSTPLPATDKKTTPFERSENFAKLGSGSSNTKLHSGRIEKTSAKSPTKNVLTQPHIYRPPAPIAGNKVYSGYVGMTTVEALSTATNIETPPYSHPQPSSPSTQYLCTCRDPQNCLRCRLLTLADRFCAIVAEREQKLRNAPSG